MEEELITLQTAKLAKEKGFDVRCEKAYFETGRHILETIRDGEITFPYKPPRILKRNYGDEFTIFIAEAPTQSLLQKWLREEYNIIVLVDYEGIDGYYYKFYSYKEGNKNYDASYKNYNTYEEALEVGLQEGLKLIK